MNAQLMSMGLPTGTDDWLPPTAGQARAWAALHGPVAWQSAPQRHRAIGHPRAPNGRQAANRRPAAPNRHPDRRPPAVVGRAAQAAA